MSVSKPLDGRKGAKGAYVNAASVVGNLEQLEAALLDQNFEGSRACVDCIFDQLLESVYRGHNDLAGSNLVDHILIECLKAVKTHQTLSK